MAQTKDRTAIENVTEGAGDAASAVGAGAKKVASVVKENPLIAAAGAAAVGAAVGGTAIARERRRKSKAKTSRKKSPAKKSTAKKSPGKKTGSANARKSPPKK